MQLSNLSFSSGHIYDLCSCVVSGILFHSCIWTTIFIYSAHNSMLLWFLNINSPLFWDNIFLHNRGGPGTHCVDQTGLKLTDIYLLLPPRIKGMCCHAKLKVIFWTNLETFSDTSFSNLICSTIVSLSGLLATTPPHLSLPLHPFPYCLSSVLSYLSVGVIFLVPFLLFLVIS